MINILKQHLFTFSFLLLVIILLILYIILGYNEILITSNSTYSQIYIFKLSLNDFFSIFSCLSILLGGIWAIFQYYKNLSTSQQAKSSECAKVFCIDILPRLSIISEVIKNFNNINDLSILLNYKQLNFNVKEQSDLNCVDICKKFIEFCKSDYTNVIFNELLENTNYNSKYKGTFFNYIIDTLNYIEYWCIDINCNAAGSHYIYSSLHTTFLRNIYINYPIISSLNTTNIDFLYTNIISVYNSWNILKQADIKKYKKNKKKLKKLEQKLFSIKKYRI